MIKVAQHKLTRYNYTYVYIYIYKAYTHKVNNIKDSNSKQTKNKTLPNKAQLYVNSNQYIVIAGMYTCMFSHK